MQALHLPEEARNWTTLQFNAFSLEDMVIGDELLSEHNDKAADYHILISERNLDEKKKKALVDKLTPLFARIFNLTEENEEQLSKINIMISRYDPTDFAVGGKFVSEIECSTRRP